MSQDREILEAKAFSAESNLLDQLKIGAVKKVTEAEVLKPFEQHISKFKGEQVDQWDGWRTTLPQRVADVQNLHKEARDKRSAYLTFSYVMIIISAVVPPIVAYLTTIDYLKPVASVIDVIPPAVVVVSQKLLSDWTDKSTAASTTILPYNQLLADIIVDITVGAYKTKEKDHKDKATKLDDIVAQRL